MAPKAAPVEEVHKVDDNPYGVFVNFIVEASSLVLDVPPPRPPTPPPPAKGAKKGAPPTPEPPSFDPAAPVLPPKTFISIAYTGEFNPVNSPHTEAEGGEENAHPPGPTSPLTYPHASTVGFRTESNEDALNGLINMPVSIQLRDAHDNRLLGHASVDLLPFALGESEIELGDVTLTAAEVVGEKTCLLQGSLLGVKVRLQQRREDGPLPPPEEGEDTEVATAVVAGEGEEVGVEAPKQQLPIWEPFSFLSEADASGANVVSLEVLSLDPLPAGLQAATDAVGGKDGNAGKIIYHLGLKLGAEGPAVVMSTRLQEGRLVFGRMRKSITAADVSALQVHLDDELDLAVELSRHVSSDAFVDNAVDAFHAVAVLPDSVKLLESGATELKPEGPLPLLAFNAEELSAQGVVGCLPVYEPPAGKAKPLEAETPDPSSCLWEKVNASLAVSLSFARPVVTPWEPPQRPSRELTEIIPTRDLNPAPPPPTADADFRVQVQALVQALAEAYAQEPPPHPETATQPPAQRHRRLIFELNRTGQYDELRNLLKAPLVRIVKERLGKSGSMNPQEMGPLYNELYTHLMAQAHLEMDKLCNVVPKAVPPTVPSAEQLASLLSLAKEYEIQGLWERCQQIHERRLLDRDNAQVWYDHATFKAHAAAAAAAAAANPGSLAIAPPSESEEECLAAAAASLKEALAIDPQNVDSLTAAALVALQQYMLYASRGKQQAEGGGGAEAAAEDLGRGYLECSIAAAYALVDVTDGSNMAWALLALAFGADSKGKDWAMCQQEVQRLERVALSEGKPARECNAYFRLWTSVLEGLKLRDLGSVARDNVPSLRRSHRQLEYSLDIITARTLLLPGRTAPPTPPSPPPAVQESAGEASTTGAAEEQAEGATASETEREGGQAGADAEAGTSEAADGADGNGGEEAGPPSPEPQDPEAVAAAEEAARKLQLGALLKKIRRQCEDESDVEPLLLKAELQWLEGGNSMLEAAVMTYQQALERNPAACGLQTHLRLAEAYMKRGEPQYALDVCTAAAELTPCASIWLAAARACMSLGDLAGARLALLEANICDPENAESWGRLALVSVRLGYMEDAQAALKHCGKVGLRDGDLYCLLAAEYSKSGDYHAAQHVLQMALDAGLGTIHIHTAMGVALVKQKEAAAAQKQLEAAASLCNQEDGEQVVLLNKLALQIEALPLPQPVTTSSA